MLFAYSHMRNRIASIAFMDVACLVASGMMGIRIRIGAEGWLNYIRRYPERWLLLIGAVLLANYLAGSYKVQHAYSRFNLVVTWLFSMAFAVLILSFTSYAWLKVAPGRGVLVLTLGMYSVLILVLKLMVYQRLFRSESFVCKTAIMGTGQRACELRRIVESESVLPLHRVIAFLAADSCCSGLCASGSFRAASSTTQTLEGIKVVHCENGDLRSEIQRMGVQLLIVGVDDISVIRRCYPELKRLRFEGVEVMTPLTVAEIYAGRVPLDHVSEEFLMQASMESELPAIRRIKRVFDMMVSTLALVILAVPMLLVAAAIKAMEPTCPVFYIQARTGVFGHVFGMIKFRTMVANAEAETGPIWAAHQDERITFLGRFLRRYRFDEVPQLLNVIKGEMSLVGPRPERPEMIAELEKSIPYYAERLNVMPGLTGWAQIRHPYGASVADARRKLEYDFFYIKNLSFSLDLQILLSTLRVVVWGKERSV